MFDHEFPCRVMETRPCLDPSNLYYKREEVCPGLCVRFEMDPEGLDFVPPPL